MKMTHPFIRGNRPAAPLSFAPFAKHDVVQARQRGLFKTLALCVAFLFAGVTFASGQTAQTQGQLTLINGQVKQLNIDIESKKLSILEAKAQSSSARTVQTYQGELNRLTSTLAIRRLELAMWQQQANFEKQPPAPNPQLQAAKVLMQQMTFEKARLTILQTQAKQMNNKAQAADYSRQITQKQAQMTAKRQEIRLIELKAKTVAPPPK